MLFMPAGRLEAKQSVLPQEYVDIYGYGNSSDTIINNRKISVLPLAHPRQIGALGAHSEKWNNAHHKWENKE